MLYQVVHQHMQTLFAQAEARSEHGVGYPAHVKREFERYLSCAHQPDAQRTIDAAEATVQTHGPDPIAPHAHRDGSVPRPYRRRWLG